MAKETLQQTQQAQQSTETQTQQQTTQQKLSVKKILLIGIPLFIVQVIIVYLIVVEFVVKTPNQADSKTPISGQTIAGTEGSDTSDKIYVVKDLIINPAGTNGNRYLLVSVGLETSNQAAFQELSQKDLQVRDVLNTVFTSKTLLELIDVSKRENLRNEIAKRSSELLKNGSVVRVYFSKYIIQ